VLRVGPKFTDSELQRLFDRNGYVITDLVEQCQIDDLKLSYERFRLQHEAMPLPFVTTSHSNDKNLIQSVDKAILEIVAPSVRKILPSSEILFSNFLLKKTGVNTSSSAHQDMTFVDEQRFTSFSIWVPLTDVDESNGCMRVVEGSHRFTPFIRPNSLDGWRYRYVLPLIEKDLKSCPMKSGQAIIFAHSLIHGSFSNRTNSNRVAAVIACYPPGAELLQYQTTSLIGELEKYKMTKEAYMAYVKGASPEQGTRVGTVTVSSVPLGSWGYFMQKRMAWLRALIEKQ
jgi:ectoine hydroxylase-related dioxygenase (phytanoyl-CoA dioxygenase family)